MDETQPTQIRFHSRLAAQWAMFYETLGVPYAYRARPVELPGGAYTPDFWLPNQQAWVEICATYPHAEDAARAQALVAATGQPVYFFCSEFRSPNSVWDDKIEGYKYDPSGAGQDYWWCECPVCGALGITYSGWSRELPCRCVWRVHIEYEKEYTYNSPRLEAAYNTVGALNVENLLVTQ